MVSILLKLMFTQRSPKFFDLVKGAICLLVIPFLHMDADHPAWLVNEEFQTLISMLEQKEGDCLSSENGSFDPSTDVVVSGLVLCDWRSASVE